LKYPDVTALVDAYKAGGLTAPVTLDNDCVNVVVPEDDEWVNAETVFETDPQDLLEALLDYLRIPWEHV
jgi:hypothetical protein